MYLGFCVAIGALCWNYYDYRAMAAETLWNSGFAEMRPQRFLSVMPLIVAKDMPMAFRVQRLYMTQIGSLRRPQMTCSIMLC